MKAFLVVALALFAMASIDNVQAAPNNPDGVKVVDLPSDAAAGSGRPCYETPSIKPEFVEPQPCDPSNPKCYQRPSIKPEYVQGDNGFPKYDDPYLRGGK